MVLRKYNPMIPGILGIIILIFSLLALILPFWLIWGSDRVNFGTLLNLPGSQNTFKSHSGFWWTRTKQEIQGKSGNCGNIGGKACVCQPFIDNAKILADGQNTIDLDRDGRPDNFGFGLFNVDGLPKCWDYDVDSCDTTFSVSTGQLSYETELSSTCSPDYWYYLLKCGPVAATKAGETAPPVNADCGTTKGNDCMLAWLNCGRICYIISCVIIIITVIVYIFSNRTNPMSLPKIALLAFIMTILNLILTIWGFIGGCQAFRHGCGNDWDRLPGDVKWGGAFACGLVALILSFFWVIVGFLWWRKARKYRTAYINEAYGGYYGKPYGGPVYYDYANDPAAYNYNYGYAYGDAYGYGSAPAAAADDGYGQEAAEEVVEEAYQAEAYQAESAAMEYAE